MSKIGLNVPEAVGFGILGATIGAVVCGAGGRETGDHTVLGMVGGAIVMVALAQVLVQRGVRALVRGKVAAKRESLVSR